MFAREGTECVALFEPGEAAVLHQVIVEVVALLSDVGAQRGDPVLDRLFPDAYPADPVSSAELRRYTEDELKNSKLDQAGAMLAELPLVGGEVRLDAEQAESWLRTLTDLRLALGIRLDLTDDTDLEEELDEAVLKDPTAPRVGQLSVYAYLTYLQESLIQALVGADSDE
jgi:uncharacterized protein DUF2017